jgi:hypothetical protein
MRKIVDFLFPSIVGTGYPAGSTNATGIESNGAVNNDGGFSQWLTQIQQNAAPAAGQVNFQTSSATTLTLTNIAGAVVMLTAGAAVTVTLDNAINIVNNIAGPYVGMQFPLTIQGTASTTMAAPTVTNTGVTLSGTTTLTSGGSRFMRGTITQMFSTILQPLTTGSTFTSITQIGSTNLYTLVLGTNAVTTTVGSVIYLGVTAGTAGTTLPAGYYPIYSAGTTSIVVALPPSNVAWTATAATLLPAGGTAPSTFAPLITLTGMYGMAAGVTVV